MTHSITRRRALAAAVAVASAQNQDPPPIGIIGLGNRSRVHLNALARTAGARIVALSDIESARIEKANAALPAKAAAYTDWRELVRDKTVSAVVIVAPNYLHHEMAIAALRAGKDVLVEKPIAISYPLARQVQREAARSGRVLAVGMQRRYRPLDSHVQQIADSGLLGTLRLITYNEFRGDWNPASWQYAHPAAGARVNWRFLKQTAGSSELELSVHTFAQVCNLAKSPLARLVASGGTVHYPGRETRDLSSAIVDFASGLRFTYSFCLFAPGGPSSFSIVGDKGVLRYERNQLLLDSASGRGQQPPPLAGHSSEDAEVLMYREFFQAVASRRPSLLSAEAALEPSKIAYAIETAVVENRIVTAADFS